VLTASVVALSAGGTSVASAAPNENGCFGQAFKVFNQVVETPTGQLIKRIATTAPEGTLVHARTAQGRLRAVGRLSREGNGSRPGEGAGELGEDGEVGVPGLDRRG
jgi:hypothetical protein